MGGVLVTHEQIRGGRGGDLQVQFTSYLVG